MNNKKILTLIIVIIFCSFANLYSSVQKTFYIKPDGDDNNNGLSLATAFQTLSKAKEAVLLEKSGGMIGDIVVKIAK